MVFAIEDRSRNAFFDLTPYIAFGGLKWSRNDVEAANAGRMQDGTMQRDRKATKYRWDVTCIPLTAAEQARILSLIQPETFRLSYTDPLTNYVETGTYYSNNFPSTFMIRRTNGTEYWTGLAFPLIEV